MSRSQMIDYSVTVLDLRIRKRLHLKGDVLDIGDGGIGIQTDYPLEPGHVLVFSGIERKTGIVKWSRAFNESEYRIGIQFT